MLIGVFSNCEKSDANESRMFLSATSPFNLQGISLTNGILVFSDTAVFGRLEREIEDFNDTYVNDTSIVCSSDTGYIAFENQIGFHSLREDIEYQTTLLEQANNLYMYNNPDNHFLFDDYLRTIVNTDLKFGIGNAIYKYINDYILIRVVDNPSLLSCIDNNAIGGDLKPCLVSSSVTILRENDYSKHPRAQYSFTYSSYTVTFNNSSIDADNYYWDFGDGTSSTVKNPTHTYNGQGPYDVVLVVDKHLTSGERLYNKTSSTLRLDGSCSAQFVCDIDGTSLEVDFIDKSLPSANSQLFSWYWSFGDGTSSTEQNPTHTYSTKGRYSVILKIKDLIDCTSYSQVAQVTVGYSQACTDAKFFSKECEYSFDNKNYKVKIMFKIKQRRFNGDILKAKIRHYKENPFGGYCRKRAAYISATITGTIYKDSTCNSTSYKNFSPYNPYVDSRKNRSKAKLKYTNRDLILIPSNIYARFRAKPIAGESYYWDSGDIIFFDDYLCP